MIIINISAIIILYGLITNIMFSHLYFTWNLADVFLLLALTEYGLAGFLGWQLGDDKS